MSRLYECPVLAATLPNLMGIKFILRSMTLFGQQQPGNCLELQMDTFSVL